MVLNVAALGIDLTAQIIVSAAKELQSRVLGSECGVQEGGAEL
jgi:hypothetical protein